MQHSVTALLKRAARIIIFGTTEPELLKEIQPMMDRTNHFSTIMCGTVLSCILTGDIFFSAISYSLAAIRSFYVIMAAVSISITITSFFNMKARPRTRLIYFYTYLLLTFSYIISILLSISGSPAKVAVTFNVFLVALPLIICDQPWRVDLLLIAMLIPHLILSYHYKIREYFVNDVYNGVIFFNAGVSVNTYMQWLHISDFKNRLVIKKQRDTDILSGVLTKSALEHRLKEHIEQNNKGAALMVIDIDNFKSINDTFGHAVGDFCIGHVGRYISDQCRQSDIVGRFGGDEFVVFMPGVIDRMLARSRAESIIESVSRHTAVSAKNVSITISIGCAIYAEKKTTYTELFNQADTALYQAKHNGKNQCDIVMI